MPSAFFVHLRTHALLVCGVLLLACAAPVAADPKPLTKEEQAKVDEAIDKGVAFLKSIQTKEGEWQWKMHKDSFAVGQCALPAYALLESGVPPDDPVVQRAAAFLRPRALKTNFTYELSLSLLFFDRLADPQDKQLMQSLALRLIAGQHRSGGWSYQCPALSEDNEKDILKYVGILSKKMTEGKVRRDKALESDIGVAKAIGSLTVFQPEKSLFRPENESSRTSLDGNTDNSNTQFAMLGLWVAQRHGILANPTFEIMVERFERSQAFPSGLWLYELNRQQSPASTHSMICVGLLGLAIGRGLQMSTTGAPTGGEKDVHVLKGFAILSRAIERPTGQMKNRVKFEDLYFLWSLERVGMLYNIQEIAGKDWYRWGAEILVTNQSKRGGWSSPIAAGGRMNYQPALSTAFALLFLKRSHPMKDLTAKLPFTAKELDMGIASLRPKDTFPVRTISASPLQPSLGGQP